MTFSLRKMKKANVTAKNCLLMLVNIVEFTTLVSSGLKIKRD